MASESVNWQDHKDIQRWMADWRDNPEHQFLAFNGNRDLIDELSHRLARGDFSGKNERSVRSFLDLHAAAAHRVSDQGKADREERSIRAAESAARAAWIAVPISIAALFLAGWPYFRA